MARHPAPLFSGAARGLLALLTLLPATGFAHDLWIVPGKYRLASGEATRVFINSGDAFPESLTLVGAYRVSELRALGPSGEVAVSELRVDGKSLTFELQSSSPGVHAIVLSTRPRTVRMKGEDFEDYLAEEGLDSIVKMRQERNESQKPAVERYTKWAKTILDVGEAVGSESPWAESAGLPFEIVPLVHPNRLPSGGPLRLKVLRDGAPLAGVRITGARAGGPARELSATTDAQGEAEVTVAGPGRWYVRALHMIRVEGDPEVAWESYWTTLSFEVQSPGAGTR